MFLLFAAFLISAYSFVSARADSPLRTVTVITVDGLTWRSFSTSKLPHLALLRGEGNVALVSPGLARYPRPEENQWDTFTAGDVINAKNEHVGLLQRQLAANGASDRVEIVRFGDATLIGQQAALDRLVGEYIAKMSGQPNSYIILCTVTPLQMHDQSWDSLSPIVVYPGIHGAGSLISTTTRTPGLVALRDIAPTILDTVGVPIPASMTGVPVRPAYLGRWRDRILGRMACITQLGQKVIVPFCWFLGLSALFAVAGGAWVASGGRIFSSAIVCYLLRLVIAAPLSLLLAPCVPVTTVAEYLAVLICLDLLIALINSAALLVCMTALVILIDGLTGSHLIAVTVVSGYWLSGIRFYGIGNEFMGILIGMSLLAPVMVFQNRRIRLPKGPQAILTAIFYLLVVFVLSYPAFGAKAGGAVTSVVAFGLAWTAMFANKRPTWVTFIVASLCGFVLIFGITIFANRLNAPPSHIQAAVAAVHQGRLGYIKHVAVRKAKMAVKTILTPGGYVAMIGIFPLWLFWRRTRLKSNVDDFLLSRQQLHGALESGAWGLLASLLYNDSGGVAFLFFFGAMALVLLHEMVKSECVSSRSMSAKFA